MLALEFKQIIVDDIFIVTNRIGLLICNMILMCDAIYKNFANVTLALHYCLAMCVIKADVPPNQLPCRTGIVELGQSRCSCNDTVSYQIGYFCPEVREEDPTAARPQPYPCPKVRKKETQETGFTSLSHLSVLLLLLLQQLLRIVGDRRFEFFILGG